MNATSIFFFASITSFLSNIPWTSIFFLTQFFGIRLYTIRRNEECIRIQKRIGTNTSETGDGGKGLGYSFGRWYFLHISEDHGDFRVWMIATSRSYEILIQDVNEISTVANTCDKPYVPVKKVKLIQRFGSFTAPWYKERSIAISLTPRSNQQTIIEEILENQKKMGHTVTYLWGEPGTGKSMIGLFLAQQTGGVYCSTMKPWKPNDTIDSLYAELEPSELSPLILVFDEFDAAIMKIHSGIEPHKTLPIAVQDKTGWNHMLDNIQRGMYPHLILVLTSNRPPEFFTALDPSYLRSGRVDCSFEMTHEKIDPSCALVDDTHQD